MAGPKKFPKNVLFFCTLLVEPILRVENVQNSFQPPVTIRPIYFLQNFHHHLQLPITPFGEASENFPEKLNRFQGRKDISSEEVNYPENGQVSSEEFSDEKMPPTTESDESNESMENPKRPPLLGDRGVMEDPSHVNRFRFLWPDATTTVTLTKRKRTRSPYHFSPHGYHPPSTNSYDSYLDQMNNARKGLDIDDLWRRDYGYGDGWESEEYGLTDEEIFHSKGYKKYRKNLKKNAKHLKKKLAVLKWFQKFLVKKKFFYPGITELDVIAPN